MTKRLLEERVVSALSCTVDSDLVRMTAEEAEENIMTYWVYEDDPTRWTVYRAERVVKTVNFCSAITKFREVVTPHFVAAQASSLAAGAV